MFIRYIGKSFKSGHQLLGLHCRALCSGIRALEVASFFFSFYDKNEGKCSPSTLGCRTNFSSLSDTGVLTAECVAFLRSLLACCYSTANVLFYYLFIGPGREYGLHWKVGTY